MKHEKAIRVEAAKRSFRQKSPARSRTAMVSPRKAAWRRNVACTVAKSSPSRSGVSHAAKAAAMAGSSASGAIRIPAPASDAAGNAVPSGAVATLRPTPIIRASGTVPAGSMSSPASLPPFSRRSLGHFKRNASSGSRPANASATAARRATPAAMCRRVTCRRSSGKAGTKVAWRLPEGEAQSRPRVPRPAVWAWAAIQRSRAPAAACSRATSCVEPTASNQWTRGPPGGTAPSPPIAQKKDLAAAVAAPTSGAGTSQNSSTKAVATASTAFTAPSIGTKDVAGSSKYITLTTRR